MYKRVRVERRASRGKITKTSVVITHQSTACMVHLIHQGQDPFLAPAKLRSRKQGERVWGARPRPRFIWQGHLMGHTAPGRSCFWGSSKWTCQMPQTGSRKLLLNDVKNIKGPARWGKSWDILFSHVRWPHEVHLNPILKNDYRWITLTHVIMWWACTTFLQMVLQNYFKIKNV